MNKRVSWLNLHLHIPQRDVRKLIYAKLDLCDRMMVEMAHNTKKTFNDMYDWCALFARRGYRKLIEFHLVQCPWNGPLESYVYVLEAGIGGHLELVKWLVAMGCGFREMDVGWFIAEQGHLHVLQWLYKQGWCCFDDVTCAYAAVGGHIHVLEWLLDKGCPLSNRVLKWSKDAKTTQWLLDNKCPLV